LTPYNHSENRPTSAMSNIIKNLSFFFSYCKVVCNASSVGLLPAILGPSFLDKRVGTGPAAT